MSDLKTRTGGVQTPAPPAYGGASLSATLVSVARGPFYPLLITVAFVITAWSDASVSLAAVWRPLILTLVIVIGLIATARLVTNNWDRAALLTLVVLFALRSGTLLHAASLALLVGCSVLAVRLANRVRGRRIVQPDITRALNAIAVILLAIVVVQAGANGTLAAAVRDLDHAATLDDMAPATTDGDAPRPRDIYLILLDGYPRADTLTRLFDYDNSTFLGRLEGRGFEVSPASMSNYMYTSLTLASMLHMRHVPDLGPIGTATDLRQLINHNPVFDLVRDEGYDVISTASPWEDVAVRSSDYRCGDGPPTDFEMHLLRGTLLLPLVLGVAPDFLAARHRSLVTGALDCLHQVASMPSANPRLVIAHVGSPHLPIVLASDGSPADLSYYSDTSQELEVSYDAFASAYGEQVSYLNRRVVAAVDSIVERDPQAIVLVMSDHGSESHFHWRDASRTDLAERFSNLFAARTPDHPDLFGPGPTPVEVFPVLFAAYFDENLPTPSADQYVSDPVTKLELRKVTVPTGASGH